jgi:hypothetical protein
VFILVGIAVGGSGVVFGAATALLGGAPGPSVSIVSASIRQGPYSAVESVTVADAGTAPLGPFVISTSQAPGAGVYCYSVEDPSSRALLSSTCPATSADPGEVAVPASVPAGGSLLVELVITGGSFALGSDHQVSVTTSSGAGAAADVQVDPA